MAELAYSSLIFDWHDVATRVPARYSGAWREPPLRFAATDFRSGADTSGTIATNNRVMIKLAPDSPEIAMAGALVRLQTRFDGRRAWQGMSDAAGYYYPHSLEVGKAYIPVAIDPSGTYECVAAGPVVAVQA